MPYEVAFTKHVPIVDREQYINECCVGGDVVVNRLLPAVRARYSDIETNQEDWGWFIWFRKDRVQLAIDVFTDDAERGEFRIHLTSRTKGWVRSHVVDTLELDAVRALVVAELQAWAATTIGVTHLDRDYR